MTSLEGWCSTIELQPRIAQPVSWTLSRCTLRAVRFWRFSMQFRETIGGRCGTRTPLQDPKTRVLPLHYILQMVRLTGFEPVWLPPPDFKSGSSHQFGHNRIYGVIVFVWYTPCKIVTYTLIRHVRLRAISLALLVSNSSKRLVVPLGFEPRYYRL